MSDFFAHSERIPREKCCVGNPWLDRSWHEYAFMPDPLPMSAITTAAQCALDPHELDWHVEAVHGWEAHDAGYEGAVNSAARCILSGGCEQSATPVDNTTGLD